MVRNTLTSSFREKIRQKAEKKAGLGATRKLPVTAVGGIKNESRAPEMAAGNDDVARLKRELELERAENAGLRAENELLRTSLTNAAAPFPFFFPTPIPPSSLAIWLEQLHSFSNHATAARAPFSVRVVSLTLGYPRTTRPPFAWRIEKKVIVSSFLVSAPS